MPIFCQPDWPMKIIDYFTVVVVVVDNKDQNNNNNNNQSNNNNQGKNNNNRIECCNKKDFKRKHKQQQCYYQWNIRHICLAIFIVIYVIIQLILPFAFLVFRGYNTWTTGIYGYNWDMMVHNWNHLHTEIKIHLINQNETRIKYLNSDLYTHNNRWTHHADMAKQFAGCIEKKFKNDHHQYDRIELYLDVWISLNGRFAQRIFDPNVDLISAEWSPFRMADWIIPIYPQSNYWRQRLSNDFDIFDTVIKENQKNGSLTLFLADRPGELFQTYIDNFKEPIRLIIFDRQLLIRIYRLSNHDDQEDWIDYDEYLLLSNDQLELLPGTMIEMMTIGSSESYFALLYPQLSINNDNQQQQQINDQSSSYLELIRNRNAYIQSIKHLFIGFNYLIWNCLIINITRLLFEIIQIFYCFC